MAKATVACPHCGGTSTYDVGFSEGDGSSSRKCPQCKKQLRIHFRKGSVHKVERA